MMMQVSGKHSRCNNKLNNVFSRLSINHSNGVAAFQKKALPLATLL